MQLTLPLPLNSCCRLLLLLLLQQQGLGRDALLQVLEYCQAKSQY
jgi:hypothetical protein